MKILVITYLIGLIFVPKAMAHAPSISTYPVKFTYKSVEPICPKDEYGQGCKAMGVIVKMEATLSKCAEKIKDFSYDAYLYDNNLNIDVYANTQNNDLLNCTEQIKISKEITVNNEYFDNVVLNNVSYENFK